MQLITFIMPRNAHSTDRYVYIGQADRLRCQVFTDENNGIAITGERVAIHQIIERLAEDKIPFQRFVSLEGRIAS
jgi:hypothetical protein